MLLPTLTFVIVVQLRNAFAGIVLTALPILMEFNLLHDINGSIFSCVGYDVTFSAFHVTDTIEEQLLNARLPIVLTPLPIATPVILEHP